MDLDRNDDARPERTRLHLDFCVDYHKDKSVLNDFCGGYMIRAFTRLLIVFFLFSPVMAKEGPPPARVVVSTIDFQEVSPNQSFIGTLYYERISHVSTQFPGLVNQVNVTAGEKISKGRPLVLLDTGLLEKEIQIQENSIRQALLSIDYLEKNYQRMDTLFQKGGVSEKMYDDARYALDDARLKKASAKTLLAKLQIQKRKSVIKAPFDGVVLEKHVDTGDWVVMGKALVTLGAVQDLFIKVPVAETLLKFLSLGQNVPVTINAYDLKVTGIIDNLFPMADAKTKNIFIKIRIPILSKAVENMSATVFLPTAVKRKLALIPRDGLVNAMGIDMVYTIEDGKAVSLPVNIVTYMGDMVGVDNDHFKPGMPVVVEGNERLRPGQAVVMGGEK